MFGGAGFQLAETRVYFRRCAACCGFVLFDRTPRGRPLWPLPACVCPRLGDYPRGSDLLVGSALGRLPSCGFPRPDCALAGRSGGMFSWTLALSSTTEMFSERLDSAIYFGPFFSVISSASEMFAEHLGTVTLLWAFDGPDRPHLASGRSLQSVIS